jgi:folylpolyglutamate synthase
MTVPRPPADSLCLLFGSSLVDKFGLEREIDSETGLLRATRGPSPQSRTTSSENKGQAVLRLVKNDFPYYTADGVEHWVLWKLGTDECGSDTGSQGDEQQCEITSDDINAAKADLQHRLGDVTDFLHWINPPHLKTVPELDHVHILCLRRRDDGGAERDGDGDDEERYRAAVQALYSPLHQSTSAEAIRDATGRRHGTVDEMRRYLERVHLDVAASCPPCLHITGTKGKGSTAAMCESILRTQHGLTTGLFTSPHLLDIRERIRIDGKPVSSRVFGRVYWYLRTMLEQHEPSTMSCSTDDDLPTLPGYFRMLTLMALYVFAHHRDPTVDVMIVEVGMGGRHDATNVVTAPKVCGIALIDYDHVQILGDTLEKIAEEKVGIYTGSEQAGEHCYVLDTNEPSPLQVIEACVSKMGGRVKLVGRQHDPVLPLSAHLGLPGRHQRDNVELAIAMCREAMQRFPQLEQRGRRHHLEKESGGPNDNSPLLALSTVSWPGRCQLVTTDRLTLYLDGAHTIQSLTTGFEWFQQQEAPNCSQALIFTCSHERNPVELLQILSRAEFDMAVFARADSERPSAVTKPSAEAMLSASNLPYRPDLQVGGNGSAVSWHDSLATVWKHLVVLEQSATTAPHPERNAPAVLSNLGAGDALEAVGALCDASGASPNVRVLVTGSLYLVGSILNAIGWREDSATGTVQIL